MKIVYLDHVAKLSGAEISLTRLISALVTAERQVAPHVILGEDGPLVSRLEEAGASVEVLPLDDEVRNTSRIEAGRLANLPVAASVFPYVGSLRRRLRELDPDIVHTNSMKSGLYGSVAGRLAGIPVVWHVRDRLAADYLPNHVASGVRAALRILPTVVVANSETTFATTGLERRRGDRAFVLYNPYRATRDPVDHEHRDGSRVRIGMVGRISPWKGQHVFIDAVLRLIDEGHDVEARLIGDAMFGEEAYDENIRALVDRAGANSQIRFLGFRDDIEAELAELDISVHASTIAEPFGQVVVEAMAAGVPVVASNAGGPAELIEDGITGILVSPDDSAELAQALRVLLEDPQLRRKLGRGGREAIANLAPELVAEKMLDIYDRALARSGKRNRVLSESG